MAIGKYGIPDIEYSKRAQLWGMLFDGTVSEWDFRDGVLFLDTDGGTASLQFNPYVKNDRVNPEAAKQRALGKKAF
jgi:hypothetical protein